MQELRPPPGLIRNQPKAAEPPCSDLLTPPLGFAIRREGSIRPELNPIKKMHAARATLSSESSGLLVLAWRPKM